MIQPGNSREAGLIDGRPLLQQWGILVAGSVALAALFKLMGLPAALLLGPMIAGIALSTNGGSIRAPRLPAQLAQAVVGCLVARAITGDIVLTFLKDWPLFLSVVLAIVVTSGALGWTMGRYDVVPGTTAVWGTAPGAASVMMVLAGAFGADARLVAFMQYMRVVCVAGLASMVGRLWVGPAVAGPQVVWFPAVSPGDLAVTLAIAAAGVAASTGLRISGGALLVPMIAGAFAESTGLVHITLPPALLAVSYALLGWSVGLGFTRAILVHARRALPQVLLATFILIAVCGALALILVEAAGIDPISAYLATSPGGMDTVAIIAASSSVDLPFVMALQTVRFVIVLFAGPPLARLIAQRMGNGG
ncbi:MAG: AbrB family transcriptional regulator [Hyphomicrobiaceae bacterium]|nr:AbrB family transcriptional regulator [Hyphomicrobiaceae bacterium]